MRLVAHLQTLHFAFHDRAQTGQLMAYANTDIQQINNDGAADPAHDRELDPDGRGRGHPLLESPGLAFFALAALPLLNISATRFSHRMHAVVEPGRREVEQRQEPEREEREAGCATKDDTTATIWIVLAIVSGTSRMTLLICWMSVFA